MAWRRALPVLLALMGCEDPSTAPPDAAPRDAFLGGLADGAPPDRAPPDGPPLDYSPPRDARYDAGPAPEQGPQDLGVVDSFAECDEGALRCAAADPALIERCRGGRWQAAPCGEGLVCVDARCLPDPAACGEGDRVCLAPDTPGACDPAEPAWRPLAPCPAGRRCRAGACEPEACADAAEAGSYLGCAFAAVPLPNFAQIYTPGTPVGLVLTNPGAQPVAVTALDPSGALGALVAEHQVTLSDDPRVPEPALGRYGPEVVRSEVRDAAGLVVVDGLALADALALPPGGTATLLLPPAGADTLARSGAFPLAWRIQTDGPVAAYQFAPFCCNFSFSNDASLLFPEAALGTDHRIAGAPVFDFEGQPAPATVAVAAPTGASVTLSLPEGANLRADGTGRTQALPDGRWRLALAPGEVWLAHVDSGQPGDPTGARVQADRPVAVFASHLCSFVPHSVGFCDHLEEQLPPVEAWGRRYALVPPPPRGRSGADQVTWWRLVPEAPGTAITLSRPLAELGAPQPLAVAGLPDCHRFATGPDTLRLEGPCELATAEPVGIVADAPLLAVGLLGGQDLVQADSPFGTRSGDPSLFLVPPDRQLRRDYAFLVPGTYALDFLTVVTQADTALTLDGEPVDLAPAAAIPGTARVFLHLPLSDGGHRITGDGPFAIRVTAFDDFVSYALTGGLDLRKP